MSDEKSIDRNTQQQHDSIFTQDDGSKPFKQDNSIDEHVSIKSSEINEKFHTSNILLIIFYVVEIFTIWFRSYYDYNFEMNYSNTRAFVTGVIQSSINLVIGVFCCYANWGDFRTIVTSSRHKNILLLIPYICLFIMNIVKAISDRYYGIQIVVDLIGYLTLWFLWIIPKDYRISFIGFVLHVIFLSSLVTISAVVEHSGSGYAVENYLKSLSEEILLFEFLHLILQKGNEEIVLKEKEKEMNDEETKRNDLILILFYIIEIITIWVRSSQRGNFEMDYSDNVSKGIGFFQFAISLILCVLSVHANWKNFFEIVTSLKYKNVLILIPYVFLLIMNIVKFVNVRESGIQIMVDTVGYLTLLMAWISPKDRNVNLIGFVLHVIFQLSLLSISSVVENSDSGHSVISYLKSLSEEILLFEFMHLILENLKKDYAGIYEKLVDQK